MIDREKVIKGLECCSETDMCCMEISCYHPKYLECPYHETEDCVPNLVKDALALLKERETVEHACDILRANGWKETEPLCSECEAVHVVQCKDCRKNMMCELTLDKPKDWFCADGKWKDS